MSRFEFIFVLVSIIAGLALTQLLSGLTRSRRSSNGTIDIAHVAFSLAIIVLLVTVWWATFRWESYKVWTFMEFVLLCGYVSLFYVMAVILYPSQSPEVPEFSKIRMRFYAIFILYCVLEIVVIYIRDGLFSPWYYLPMMIHLILLSSLGMLLRKDRFDQILAVWLCLVNFSWPFFARLTG
jgi:hypothetical protein